MRSSAPSPRFETRIPFLDLSREVESMRDELEHAVTRVLDEGRFVSGPFVEEFESEFASFCGTEHAVGVASGTDAITIALAAVGVGAGDEVVTAANTCVPTVAGIEATGARPVLADIDPETYTLDPAALELALTERTRAILPVHLYGQCADMYPILELARSRGLRVVEDAAHAHGAEYRGRRAGTLGDAAAFSFYPTKNLGALGDGGAVVTRSAEVAGRARCFRSYGESEPSISSVPGWNSRLDALQAAVLSAKLQRLPDRNARRRLLASRYRELLHEAPFELPVEVDGRLHAYHLFVVRVRDRDRFRSALDEAQVGTLVHYSRPIHSHPAYSHLAPDDGRLQQSERACGEVVSLPLYPELSDEEVEFVADGALAAAGS
jgi:dTDP-4-amino-4,6-dideoxygalactose transaminase